MSVLAMVLSELSTTEPRTASEICHALPLTLATVEATLLDLDVRGAAWCSQKDEQGVVRWLMVRA